MTSRRPSGKSDRPRPGAWPGLGGTSVSRALGTRVQFDDPGAVNRLLLDFLPT